MTREVKVQTFLITALAGGVVQSLPSSCLLHTGLAGSIIGPWLQRQALVGSVSILDFFPNAATSLEAEEPLAPLPHLPVPVPPAAWPKDLILTCSLGGGRSRAKSSPTLVLPSLFKRRASTTEGTKMEM